MGKLLAGLLCVISLLILYVWIRTTPPWVSPPPGRVLPSLPANRSQEAVRLYEEANTAWAHAQSKYGPDYARYDPEVGPVAPDAGQWLAGYAETLDLLHRARQAEWTGGLGPPDFDGDVWCVAAWDYRLQAFEGRSRAALERALDLAAGSRRLGTDWPGNQSLNGALRQPDSLLQSCSTRDLRWFLERLNELEAREPLTTILLDPLIDLRDRITRGLTSPRAREQARNRLDWRIEFASQSRVEALAQWERSLADRTEASQHILPLPINRSWERALAIRIHGDPYEADRAVDDALGTWEGQGEPCVVLATETAFQDLRIQVAGELYRREHSRRPRGWSDLVPSHLPRIPQDPFLPGVKLQWVDGMARSVGTNQRPDKKSCECRELPWPGGHDLDVRLGVPGPLLVERWEFADARAAFLVEPGGGYSFWRGAFDEQEVWRRLDPGQARKYREALRAVAARRTPPEPFTARVVASFTVLELPLSEGTLWTRVSRRPDGVWVEPS